MINRGAGMPRKPRTTAIPGGLSKLKTRIFTALLAIATFFSGGLNAAGQPGGVDSLMLRFMESWNIGSGAIAITRNGHLVFNKGFGQSDQAADKPAAATDLYRIASVSKPVTAISIMKLVETGRLSLSDTVFGEGGLLNDPYYTDVISDERLYGITVNHLLEHTAGWDRSVSLDGQGHADPAFFPLHVTDAEHAPDPVGDSTLIRYMLRRGLNFTPGKKFAYSNVGYLVLGKVIEKASGVPYEQFVKREILHPIGVYDMHLGKNLRVEKHEREVEYLGTRKMRSVYGTRQRVPSQYGGFNLEAMNAHGGWIATASDLTRLLVAVDGFDSYPDILSEESIRKMTRPGQANTNYARGWAVNGRGSWWHTGSLDGTAAFVGRTADGYTWAILFNGRGGNKDAFWSELDRLPWLCIKALQLTPSVQPVPLGSHQLTRHPLHGKLHSEALTWHPAVAPARRRDTNGNFALITV
jgi:CubicO group peptidase (beta-lactamase class C family)